MDDVTRLLNSASPDELLQWVYDELRQIARARMFKEQPGHTLQATALVHEAWLRLRSGTNGQWDNRAHFFAAAGEAMRRILVDSARRRLQLKRGGDMERVDLHESQIGSPYDEEKLLQVHEVLNALAVEDPLKAQIVKLRFFVGLNHHEIAEALSLNEKTIRRHWEVAKVRLYELIRSQE